MKTERMDFVINSTGIIHRNSRTNNLFFLNDKSTRRKCAKIS